MNTLNPSLRVIVDYLCWYGRGTTSLTIILSVLAGPFILQARIQSCPKVVSQFFQSVKENSMRWNHFYYLFIDQLILNCFQIICLKLYSCLVSFSPNFNKVVSFQSTSTILKNNLLCFQFVELLNLIRHFSNGILVLLSQTHHGGLLLNGSLFKVFPQLLNLSFTFFIKLHLM